MFSVHLSVNNNTWRLYFGKKKYTIKTHVLPEFLFFAFLIHCYLQVPQKDEKILSPSLFICNNMFIKLQQNIGQKCPPITNQLCVHYSAIQFFQLILFYHCVPKRVCKSGRPSNKQYIRPVRRTIPFKNILLQSEAIGIRVVRFFSRRFASTHWITYRFAGEMCLAIKRNCIHW